MTDLLIHDDGAVRVLTMNRPEKRNALNLALSEALFDALREADGAAGVRAIVLTGAGPAFCAGADLSEFAALSSADAALVERRADITAKLHGVFSQLTKPVVTAINGAAMGGGAGLALAGDIAIMSATAKLGYPEVKHGIVASVVMANLVRQAGRKAAFELVATGEPIDASRALELGLVNRAVAPEMLMDEAMQSARAMAAVAPQAMAATKTLFYRVAELPFDQALEAGREVNQRMRALPQGQAMNLTTVRYGVEGGVATLTLDRPEARNALNRAMCDDIVAATAAARDDDEVRLVLIRATGPVFCAGADLKERKGMAPTKFAPGGSLPTPPMGRSKACRCR